MPRSRRTIRTHRLAHAAVALVAALGDSGADVRCPGRLGDDDAPGGPARRLLLGRQRTGTYEERDCYRSPVNYGTQVATSIGATYTDVACRRRRRRHPPPP